MKYGISDFHRDGSITAEMADRAYVALDIWLHHRALDWLDELSVAWLDSRRELIYARRGKNLPGSSINEAIVRTANVDGDRDDCASAITTADGQIRGYVGINTTHCSPTSLIITTLLRESTLNNTLSDDGSLEDLLLNAFESRDISPPPYVPIRQDADIISSQAGLQALMMGAKQQGLFAGGHFGIPPMETTTLPQPAPGVELITTVPGHGGGLCS